MVVDLPPFFAGRSFLSGWCFAGFFGCLGLFSEFCALQCMCSWTEFGRGDECWSGARAGLCETGVFQADSAIMA